MLGHLTRGGGSGMNGRPGYWDTEACAWMGAEPIHVVPPVPASACSAAPAGAQTGTDDDPAAVPPPRITAESKTPPHPVAPDATTG